LEVSRIAFGTWQLGGEWGSVDADEAKAAIRHAIDLGVSFFDTAQAYGFGASERMLGEALRQELDSNRDSVIIATKGGINPGKDPARDSSREWLRDGVHSSLAALGVDYIDLYQVHWPDERTALRTPLGISRSSLMPARFATSESPTSMPNRWRRSRPSGRWRRCSRRITCFAAESRPRCCRTASSTTSVSWSTARSEVGY
jgi:hypothetical protein